MKTTQAGEEKNKSRWKTVLALLFLAGFAFLLVYAPMSVVAMFFPVLVLVCLLASFGPNFYKTEQRLATSQIRSLAMGLVEIRGKVLVDTPLLSPVHGKPCAGYVWIIEEGEKDDDGRWSWSRAKSEARCNDFRLQDSTGEISVVAEGIDLFGNKSPDDYEPIGSSRRQGEILLSQDLDVMLIGDAGERDGRTVIAQGRQPKSVFGVALTADVENRRVLAPLWRVGSFYAAVVAMLAVGVMAMTPAHFAQLHLPGPDTYQQMESLGPVYKLLAWLYREGGFPIPFMAAFGFMLTLFIVLIWARLLLPKGMRLAVGRVLGAWMGLGMVIGGVVTLLLFVAHVDALKQFLVWMLILLGTLVFSLFEQRKMGVAYKHFAKRVSKSSFGDEDA
ncbi:hypothetical protein BLL37_10705 [Pseudomonas azotoformans]|uniref:RING-type E3 ubiquitin transferase n=1 Tax=Pseudomonas azotoformans TaxID=47878 RepID=A0A1V2JIX8_PSEAZ|nr:hypothetical protein [Pseudomonas azotoformans]OIN47883.1 hypothetical protein BFL39_16415 [Pseudomonas azotoformans]ONH45447.1 hypothetical protein BLL37_10705 [Pseudomonas azotoformans]SDO34134.1 hypothetical protein SAMN04489799_4389 [Pseudomonas azotoformans]